MTKKAYFYRNATDIKEYENILSKYKIYTDYLTFKISKKILLKGDQYNFFIEDFRKEKEFIKNNINLMKMDKNDVVSCLLVYSRNYNFGILVYSAGYSYARYVAKIIINSH